MDIIDEMIFDIYGVRLDTLYYENLSYHINPDLEPGFFDSVDDSCVDETAEEIGMLLDVSVGILGDQ